MAESSENWRYGSIGFVGAGAVGSTLARAMVECGFEIRAVAAKNIAHAQALAARLPLGMAVALTPEQVALHCDLVFLAVTDGVIEPLAEFLPWQGGQSVVHFAGAKGSAALVAAQRSGARVAALHPLMSFPRTTLDSPAPSLLDKLRGCCWSLETQDVALSTHLHYLVGRLGGYVLTLDAKNRLPYHIAAVFGSNYVVALVAAACELLEMCGLGREESLRALLPLVRSSVENLAELGIPQALSGPVARGDAGTIASHLQWLARYQNESRLAAEASPTSTSWSSLAQIQADSAVQVYRALAQVAVLLATEKGSINQEQSAAIRALLAPGS